MLLEVSDLTMEFGGLKALDSVSLSVPAGSIKGLIGPNGSGKTTLFNVISGFYRPTRGAVRFSDRDITTLKPHQVARLGLVRTFQGTLLFEKRTLRDNLLLSLQSRRRDGIAHVVFPSRGCPDVLRAEELLDFVGLLPLRDERVENIPVGMRHLLEIARVVSLDPRLVLLDEPSSGLNHAEVAHEMDIIRRIRDRGITVFIVEHNMKVIMDLSDSITVLDMGGRVADGAPAEIRRDPRVIECYLGSDAHQC